MIINNSYVQLKFFTKENLEVIKKYDWSDFRNNTQFYPYEYQTYFDLAREVENEFDGAAVFITRKPSLFTLFSNRDAVIFPFTDDSLVLNNFFSNHAGHFLVYDQKNNEMRVLENYIALNPDKFSLLYISHEDEIAIFEIIP